MTIRLSAGRVHSYECVFYLAAVLRERAVRASDQTRSAESEAINRVRSGVEGSAQRLCANEHGEADGRALNNAALGAALFSERPRSLRVHRT